MQDAKLDGQAVAVRLDVGIHATRIGLKVRAILRRSNLQRFLGGYSDPKNSLLAIMLKKIPSEDFRNLTGGEAPHNVHLPQTVLRGYISLGKEEILEAGRVDGGDPMLIPAYGNSCGQAGKLDSSIQLR